MGVLWEMLRLSQQLSNPVKATDEVDDGAGRCPMLLSSEPHHVPSPGCRPSDARCGVCGHQALADVPADRGAAGEPGRLICQVCGAHALARVAAAG